MKFILILFITITFVLAAQSVVLCQSQDTDSQQTEKIYLPNEVDVKLKIKEKIKAQYTENARRNCVNGKVLLKVVFTSSGNIGDVEVVKGLPEGLSESAVEAAHKIKFEPAQKDGQKVSVSAKVEYDFDFSRILPCKNGKRTR
jgi:TonB family protein